MSTFNISQILPCIQKQQFSQCIGQLTYLIQNTNQNSTQQKNLPHLLSTLYLNRGIMEIHEGRLEQSLQDLQKSLKYNHLNYAAYFNIFSVRYMNSERVQSFRQLCCALSCLYLQRGRIHKDDMDINKAIKYCENNIQARIAKCLNFFKKQKFSLALNEIKWVLDINPSDKKSLKICRNIQKLLKINTQLTKDKENTSQFQQPPLRNYFRLDFSYYEEDQLQQKSIQTEIAEKIAQFNQLYLQINGQPIQMLNNTSPGTYLLYKNLNIDGFGNLSSINQNVISALSMPQYQQDINQSKQNKQIEIDSQIYPKYKKNMENFCQISSVRISQQPQSSQYSRQNYTLTQNRDNTSIESGLTLQIDGQKCHTIKVISIDIFEKQKYLSKPQENNLYCLFQYGQKQFKSLQSSQTWQNQNWQSQIQTSIDNQPQMLKIKVFNKQIMAFNDTLIGIGQKQLTQIGRIDIPFYKKPQTQKNNQQMAIGVVKLEIKNKMPEK